MTTELQVFNYEGNDVRTMEIDGEPWFVGKDVARILKYDNPSKAIRDHVPDEDKIVGGKKATPSIVDSLGRIQYPTWINESGLYSLIFSSKQPAAVGFKRWVTSALIPAIRKTGSFGRALSSAELLVAQAQALLAQERRIASVENKLELLEANIETRPEHCYTVAGYASIRGIRLDVNRANMLGRKAVRLSREYDYEVSKTQVPCFGTVNAYHEDILKVVFDGERTKR